MGLIQRIMGDYTNQSLESSLSKGGDLRLIRYSFYPNILFCRGGIDPSRAG